MGGTWHNVTKREPCPICHKPDWCTVSNDGMMCVCRRVESNHPAKSGMGWIHVLVERPRREFVPRMPKRPKPQLFDAAATMAGYRAEFEAPGGGKDIFDSLLEIANDLDMCAAHIDRLLVGRSAFHGAWAFPMLDGEANCVGIRLREYGGSRKWSVAGSRDGLFYDPQLEPCELMVDGAAVVDSTGIRWKREIVVVEGATDTIAGYALGLPCVGRSSCGTGAEALKALCRRLRVQSVTIFADNDAYKVRPNGVPWRPGIEGAVRLGEALQRPFRIVMLPRKNGHKDLRDWSREELVRIICLQAMRFSSSRISASVHSQNARAINSLNILTKPIKE